MNNFISKNKKELDFLFIASPTNARNPHPPYYFLYLSSYLEARGLKCQIIDIKGGDTKLDIENHIRTIQERLPSFAPRFVGLASFHSDYSMIMKLGQQIKKIYPDTNLIVGNVHATLNPEDFIYKNSPFDFAVLGEGEETCYNLWRFFNQEYYSLNDLTWVFGIAYLENYGCCHKTKLVKTEKRKFIKLVDIKPDYNKIDMSYYLQPQKLILRRLYTRSICVFSGRGCPYSCSFCPGNDVWKANKGNCVRLRPIDSVLEEINYLKGRYDIDAFYMADDTFGYNKNWINEWFDKFYIDLPYACQTRANLLTEDIVRGFKESGCIQLDIGVETGNEALLRDINKKITLEQIKQAFEWCRKYKIRSFATMMINLPNEDQFDLQNNELLLDDIKPTAGTIFSIATPYPGTKMYEDYCEPKLKKEEYDLLLNNRLEANERFRMSFHQRDLNDLWERLNRKYLATPMFERMWAMKPFQKKYWRAIFNSKYKKEYLKAWVKDLYKTFILWWLHRLNLYRILKERRK